MIGYLFFSADEKFIFDKNRLLCLEEWKPKVVIISSHWEGIKELQTTKDLIEFIGKQGSKVVLIEDPPTLFFGDRNAPQYLAYLGLTPLNKSKQYIRDQMSPEFKRGENLIHKLADMYDYCKILPTRDIFLNNNKDWVIDGSDVLYIDDDHLSFNGSLKVKQRMLEILKGYF